MEEQHGLQTTPDSRALSARCLTAACHGDSSSLAGRWWRRGESANGNAQELARAEPLPGELHYYSLITLPQPDRISSILQSSYDKLARIDGRNDSQVIFYDQVVPGSTLLGYVNADHWALAVPIARTHSTISSLFVTKNAYPREALLEAVLRFIEEDL